MFKMIRKILLALVLALPAVAMASVVMPGGGNNAWDIYTMGNGSVIVQILQATIAIVGNSGYRTLLLLVATGGFLFLAIQAGFDFGKNFMRMFTYIFVVWLVVLTSSSITTNVQVDDEVTNSYQGVANVPAVVGLPAAMITGIGHWLAQNIATSFGVDPMLSVSGGTGGGAGGGFNIFGDMMEDANNFTITSPELKNSLAAFTGDCVVAELGMQLMTPTQMESSANLWQDMGKVIPQGVMTRYYYPTTPGTTPPSTMTCPGSSESFTPAGTGAILSCPAAYACLTQDLANHAQGLLDAKQSQWAATGAVTPYNSAFQAAITQVSGGNSSGGAVTPQSVVQQEALINEMHGAFRQAAVTTGDNSLLINANVASAEQQQKSAFYVGSLVTEHMAGYIFTVLQAFLFAIVPIVIVAALIPGLGRQVATSYIQMLVWLALWEPMYEIVNFLILAFSHQSLGVTYATWTGPTMGNQFTMNEQTSNLVAAARMLGSSVPILALGLVKGGIALESFAKEALGSQFANSAGTQSALGGFSEAGVSLSQVNGNKYNTASESVVGTKDTTANLGAGTLSANVGLGGESATAYGSSLGTNYSAQQQLSGNTQVMHDANIGNSGARNMAAGSRVDSGNRNDMQSSVGSNVSSNNTTTLQNQGSKSKDARQSTENGQDVAMQHSNGLRESSDASGRLSGGMKDGGSFGAAKAQGPQQVQVVGGEGGLPIAAHGGAPGVGAPVGGAPAAGAGGPATAATGSGGGMGGAPMGGGIKGTNNGLAGDLGGQGSVGVSRSVENGLTATSSQRGGHSQSYSEATSTQSSLGNASSYGTGQSASQGHSLGSSSSHSHNADNNSTFATQAGTGDKASETDSSSNSVTRTTNFSGGFQQGSVGSLMNETHAFQNGFWDSSAAATQIKADFLSGLAGDTAAQDRWSASAGPDWQAAHASPVDPGPVGGASAQPAVPNFATQSGLTDGWDSLVGDQAKVTKSVDRATSILEGNASSTQSVLGSASRSFFPDVHIGQSPDATNGVFVSPGASVADGWAQTGLATGGASVMVSRYRTGRASDGAARLAQQVNP
jgi:hypothetical protein